MKVLVIGTDRKLFDKNSQVFSRQIEYAAQIEELQIVVFALKNLGFSPIHQGNLHIHPTNSSSRWSYISDAVKIGRKIIAVRNFSKGQSVVSVQDPFESGLVGKKLKKEFGLSLQIQIHTDFLSPYFKNSLLNRIRVRIAHRSIPKADGIRVVSSVIADSLREKFPNLKAKVSILPIFVDVEKIMEKEPLESLKQQFPQFDHVIFMASRLSSEKRFDTAFRVFKKVLEQFPKAGLIIAGDGEEKEKLKRLAQKLGIEKNIVFLGWKEDLISYYKTADIFLFTSEFEGYGMTLIEAGAAGCPIITTSVGVAQTTLFQDTVNSYVCEVDNVRHIAKHVTGLLSDPQKRELFKKNMQDSIRGVAVSREEYISKYVATLKDLL